MVDGNGRLVGLVVATGGGTWATAYADSGPAVQQLIESGHVTYPGVGITYENLTLGAAADRGWRAGALVLAVTPGSSAERAGVAAGEVVTGVNGTRSTPNARCGGR